MNHLSWTRRQAVSVTLAAGSAGLLGSCDDQSTASIPVSFDHGVASGDPLQDRVILWTRAQPQDEKVTEFAVEWQVSRDPEFKDVVVAGTAVAISANNFAVKVDATDLTAGTSYFYRFNVGDQVSQTGRTKTLPAGAVDQIKFAVVSCSNYSAGYFHVYKEIAKREDIDVVLHLGDYIYEYGTDGFGGKTGEQLGRVVEPPHEIVTLNDYRERYAQYRRDPDLQAAHAAHPFIAIWDDHETANDSWATGAENHNDEKEGKWADRVLAATQAYFEWLPVRPREGTAVTRNINRSFQFGDLASLIMLEGRLSDRDAPLSYTKDLPFVATPFDFTDPDAPKAIRSAEALKSLDPKNVRTVRTPFDFSGDKPKPILDFNVIKTLDPKNFPPGIGFLPNRKKFLEEILGDEDRQVLGEEQEVWVALELQDSVDRGVTWQVLGNPFLLAGLFMTPLSKAMSKEELVELEAANPTIKSVNQFSQLGLPLNLDQWDGYPAARRRLYEAIIDAKANAVVVSGDSHAFWANELRLEPSERPIAVEFGTSSVTSPGIPEILPLPSIDQNKLLGRASPEVRHLNLYDRGYLVLTLTPEEARADLVAISSVKQKDYEVLVAKSIRVRPSNGDGVSGLESI